VDSTWGIVLAGGSGARFGAHKQFELLGDERLIDRVVRVASDACDGLILVLPAGVAWDGQPVAEVVEGGNSHAASTRAGLAALPAEANIVVITAPSHPLISPQLYGLAIAAITDGVDAAAPLLPVADAVKTVGPEGVRTLTSPGRPHLAQLPFAFRRSTLDRAVAAQPDFVEELEAIEALGGTVAAVPGDPENVHVTTPADLEIVRRLSRTR
jgi:2-C-methyl-D-erythritol 4-phosphate cytidylyltransferase